MKNTLPLLVGPLAVVAVAIAVAQREPLPLALHTQTVVEEPELIDDSNMLPSPLFFAQPATITAPMTRVFTPMKQEETFENHLFNRFLCATIPTAINTDLAVMGGLYAWTGNEEPGKPETFDGEYFFTKSAIDQYPYLSSANTLTTIETGKTYDWWAAAPVTFECGRGLEPQYGPAICGNGLVEIGERCDDGNAKEFDGCDNNCVVEPGFQCVVAAPNNGEHIDGPQGPSVCALMIPILPDTNWQECPEDSLCLVSLDSLGNCNPLAWGTEPYCYPNETLTVGECGNDTCNSPCLRCTSAPASSNSSGMSSIASYFSSSSVSSFSSGLEASYCCNVDHCAKQEGCTMSLSVCLSTCGN